MFDLTEDDMKKVRNIPKRNRVCPAKELFEHFSAFDY